MQTLKIGSPAPEFELKNQYGAPVKLTDFAGRKVLIYFYPRANTPGCTKQACAVQEILPQLHNQNTAAIGISPDAPARQKKFAEKYNLTFPLLADESHEVAQAFGVWGEKKRCGRTSVGIIRSAFLVDTNGLILQTWYNVKATETAPKALASLNG